VVDKKHLGRWLGNHIWMIMRDALENTLYKRNIASLRNANHQHGAIRGIPGSS
jgi:hypothetical protein